MQNDDIPGDAVEAGVVHTGLAVLLGLVGVLLGLQGVAVVVHTGLAVLLVLVGVLLGLQGVAVVLEDHGDGAGRDCQVGAAGALHPDIIVNGRVYIHS